MKSKTISFALSAIFVFSLTPLAVKADKSPNQITREILAKEALSNIPNQNFTAVTVQLDPGVTVPRHSHSGFVFVFVLDGTIVSQLNDNKIIEYKPGESWVELPNAIHSLTKNPSQTTKAKFLAITVAKEDAKLTIMEKSIINQKGTQ